MLFITGLLTLLAIAHAGGDHVKGGSRIKGGPAVQEKVAQEDIIPSPFNIKSPAAYGTKIIRQEPADVLSKTAQEPIVHHSVKTLSKAHPSPAVHHAAVVSVKQDQVIINDPSPDNSGGIKTLKARGKSEITKMRDPTARPVIQTVKTERAPTADLSKRIKTVKVASSSSQGTQNTDPIVQPIVKTVKTVQAPSAVTQQIKTVVTADNTKIRFSQKDSQIRDPVSRPIIPGVKTAPKAGNINLQANALLSNLAYGRRSFQSSGLVDTSGYNAAGITEVGEKAPGSDMKVSQNLGGTGPISAPVSGTVLFNGKEISIDGLKEGQMFDENLRPIVLGTPGSTDTNIQQYNKQSIVLESSSRRAPQRPRGPSAQFSQTGVLRTTVITSPSIAETHNARQGLPSELSSPNVRTSLPISGSTPAIRAPQNLGSIGASGLPTSGTVLFNGKEINVDGIREGQIFDENLRPIVPGLPGAVEAKSPTVLSNIPQSGPSSSRRVQQKPRERAPQLSDASALRRTGVTGQSLGTVYGSRQRTSVTQTISGLSAASPSLIPSSVGRTPSAEGIVARGKPASGKVLFNGKEISIDGLKEGQIFDENLRPIVLGAPVTVSGGLAEAGVLRSPGAANPSVDAIVNSRRGTVVRQSAQSLGISSPASRPSPVRRGPQFSAGLGPRGTPASGVVTFNGQEIKVDGLKEGQIFDENLRPIMSGLPGAVEAKSPTVLSNIPQSGPSSRRVQQKPRERAPQLSDAGALRRTGVTGQSLGTVYGSRQRTSVTQTISGLRAASPALIPSSVGRTPSAEGIVARGKPASGKVLFNGKEISIDGLKEGQIFDENLRPIVSGAPVTVSGGLAEAGVLRSPGAANPSVDAIVNSRRGTVVRQSAQSLGISSPASRPSPVRRGPQFSAGSGASGAPASGVVTFNGQEIKVDGLKEGQIFDENLRPIMSGLPGAVEAKSPTVLSNIPQSGPSSRRVQQKPRDRAPQLSDAGALRRTGVTGQSLGTVYGSRQRTSVTQTISGLRAASPALIPSSVGRTASAEGIVARGKPASGKVLFNGKEISIDGLKEGQIFDENLRPIVSGAPATVSRGLSKAGVLRRPGTTNPSADAIANSRRGTVVRQSAQSLGISSPASRPNPVRRGPQFSAGSGPSGAPASGVVTFNGQEIKVDGLKEGQIFDENLRPIMSGLPGAVEAKSPTVLSNIPQSGLYSSRVQQKPRERAPQLSDAGALRRTGVTGQSLGTVYGSRQRTSVTQTISGLRAASPALIPSSVGRTPSAEGIVARGKPASGKVLFNEKEISIDGLKEGQIFDENLRPIESGAPATVSGGLSKAGVLRRPGTTNPSADAIANARRGTVVRQSAQNLGISSPASRPSPVRRGPQFSAGSGPSGAPASGVVTFNGQEIKVDGLKEGQIFDENLRPIMSGLPGAVEAKSPTVLSNIPQSGLYSSRVQQKPRERAPQLSDAGALRRTGVTGQSLRTVYGSRQRTSVTQTISGLRAASPALIPSSVGRTPSAEGIVARGKPASGKVMFNGKEISIDGLKEGQIFDENLRPIVSGAPVTVSGGLAEAGVLRSPGAANPSVDAIVNSRRGTVVRQSAQSLGISSPASRPSPVRRGPQFSAGSGPSGTPASGVVTFNGQEIKVDGLKEGQIFDENLRPIMSGLPGAVEAKSPTVLSNNPQSGLYSSRRVQQKPRVRAPQLSDAGGLRKTGVTGLSLGTVYGSKQRTSVTQTISGLRAASPALIPSSVGRTPSSEGIVTRGKPASGKVLFNGKEISMDGLKEGQIFDENVRPIVSGAPATVSGGLSKAGVLRRPGTTNPSADAIANSRRGTVVRQTAQSLGISSPASRPSPVRRGPQFSAESGASGTPASGVVIFNGQEINVDGLKEGQIFDENLQPIVSRTTGAAEAKSPGYSKPSSIPLPNTSPLRNVQKSRGRSRVSPQAGVLRTPGVNQPVRSIGSARGNIPTIQSSNLGSSAGSSSFSPGRRGPQSVVDTGIRGSLASGTVLFNGKEIRVDGLQEGQIFDENLRPIVTRTEEGVEAKSFITSEGIPMSGVLPTAGVSQKPVGRSPQLSQSGVLRAPGITVSSLGAVDAARRRAPTGQLRPNTLTRSPYAFPISEERVHQSNGGTRGIGSPASGTVLFNGKEVALDVLKEGQMFDENLKPISSRVPGAVVGNIPQYSEIGSVPQPGVSSSLRVSQRPGAQSPQFPHAGLIRTPDISSSSTGATDRVSQGVPMQSYPNLRINSPASSPPSSRRGPQSVTTIRQSASPASGTVLFNGKEIRIDGLNEGQLFDENLQPILSEYLRAGGEPSVVSKIDASSGLPESGITSFRGDAQILGGMLPQLSGRANLRSPDVIRGDISQDSASRISPGGVPKYVAEYGSRRGNIDRNLLQEKISHEITHDRVDVPLSQETSFYSPDSQQKLSESDILSKIIPSKTPTSSVQTQLKVEDLVEQTSLPKTILKSEQVQESIPFSVPDTPQIVQKKRFVKVTSVTKKDSDIPVTQQKLVNADVLEYLPKTSFLPPFNYAPPQLSASKYSIKNPIVQEQQKLEQIFV